MYISDVIELVKEMKGCYNVGRYKETKKFTDGNTKVSDALELIMKKFHGYYILDFKIFGRDRSKELVTLAHSFSSGDTKYDYIAKVLTAQVPDILGLTVTDIMTQDDSTSEGPFATATITLDESEPLVIKELYPDPNVISHEIGKAKDLPEQTVTSTAINKADEAQRSLTQYVLSSKGNGKNCGISSMDDVVLKAIQIGVSQGITDIAISLMEKNGKLYEKCAICDIPNIVKEDIIKLINGK